MFVCKLLFDRFVDCLFPGISRSTLFLGVPFSLLLSSLVVACLALTSFTRRVTFFLFSSNNFFFKCLILRLIVFRFNWRRRPAASAPLFCSGCGGGTFAGDPGGISGKSLSPWGEIFSTPWHCDCPRKWNEIMVLCQLCSVGKFLVDRTLLRFCIPVTRIDPVQCSTPKRHLIG